MMKTITTFLVLILISVSIFAQVPEAFKYQSVIRDGVGNVMPNQQVGVQIGIVQGSQTATPVYSETFDLTTNDYGLLNLNIGEGNSTDNFEDIDWTMGPNFIKLELDVDGGTNYEEIGVSALKSVPFTLLSKDVLHKQVLNISNDTLYLTDGGQVYLGAYNNVWTTHGNDIYNSNTKNVGVGIEDPMGKFVIQGDTAVSDTLPLFEVKNKDGITVFAVYDGGVRVYVNDDPAKANNNKSGFAIGGYRLDKSVTNEYMRITPDSVRIYIKENDSNKDNNSKGGFAIGGYRLDKTTPDDYFNIFGTDTLQTINPSQPRILWYPLKEAFLAGRVLIESPDSVGQNSFATGYESKAIGTASQALGFHARSYGANSIAIGNYANAEGDNSFAFGDSTIAKGYGSYAFGSTGVDSNTVQGMNIVRQTIARGSYSFAMGFGAYADSTASIAMGAVSSALGSHSVAIGLWDTTFAPLSYAIGIENKTYGIYSLALGSLNKTYGDGSFSIGQYNVSNGNGATTFGTACYADGDGAFAIGISDTASAGGALAMGYQTKASGLAATSFGSNTISSGIVSTSFGNSTMASGMFATAFGTATVASGGTSTAFGTNTAAIGAVTTAFGSGTIAEGINSTVFGKNMTVNGDYSFGINLGNGSTPYATTQNNSMIIMGGKVGIGTLAPARALHVYSLSAPVSRLTLSNNNGTLIEFWAKSSAIAFIPSSVGSITVNNGTVSYNTFTGSHLAKINAKVEQGELICLTGNNSFNDKLNQSGEIIYGAIINQQENSPNILGAYLGEHNSNDLVMAVGNGSMWVVDNGQDLEIGDYLISSSIKGHATVNNGKYEVSHIIARVAEPVSWKKETKDINGVKHKLVSVFFESFDLHNFDNKLNKQQNEIDILKKEIEELKQILDIKASK